MRRMKIFNTALILVFSWSCKPDKPSQKSDDNMSSSDKQILDSIDDLGRNHTANRGSCKILTASEAKSVYSKLDDKEQPNVQEEDGLVACSFAAPKGSSELLNARRYTGNAASKAKNDWVALKKAFKCSGEDVTSDHQNLAAQFAEICIDRSSFYYFLKGNNFALQFMFLSLKGKDKAEHRADFKRLAELVDAHQ